MKGTRVLAGCAAALLLLAACFFSLLSAGSLEMYEHSAQNDRVLDAEFRQGAAIVGTFRIDHGRWPTRDEIGGALRALSDREKYQLAFDSDGDCEWRALHLPDLKVGEHMLSVWRGEWLECYNLTTRRSTLVLSAGGYAMSGSVIGDCLMYAVIGLSCVAGAIWSVRYMRYNSRPGNERFRVPTG